MNIIHQLQDQNERQAEVIAELRAALADIRDYCGSAKYAEHGSTMNPADIIHRVRDWTSRVNAVEQSGKAVVDDDGPAIVALAVRDEMRRLANLIKKHEGIYNVGRQAGSHIWIVFNDSSAAEFVYIDQTIGYHKEIEKELFSKLAALSTYS